MLSTDLEEEGRTNRTSLESVSVVVDTEWFIVQLGRESWSVHYFDDSDLLCLPSRCILLWTSKRTRDRLSDLEGAPSDSSQASSSVLESWGILTRAQPSRLEKRELDS